MSSTRSSLSTSANRQRGTSLIEVLAAFLVVSLGMLASARIASQFRLGTDTARQRAEAVRLAEEDIEHLRAFASIEPSNGGRAYSEVVSAQRTFDSTTGYATNTRYQLDRQVATSNVASARTVAVTVAWKGREGKAQRVVLSSIVSASDPVLAGALTLAPVMTAVNAPFARAVGVPFSAKNLGNRSSVYRPTNTGAVAYLFDNMTGQLTSRCTLRDAAVANAAIVVADLSACVAATSYLPT